MTHYYDDWKFENIEKKKKCKWKNSGTYCWSTRYGCIDCDKYEPIYDRPEVDKDFKPFIDKLNNTMR